MDWANLLSTISPLAAASMSEVPLPGGLSLPAPAAAVGAPMPPMLMALTMVLAPTVLAFVVGAKALKNLGGR